MSNIAKRKRSRGGIIGFMTKIIKTELKEIYENYTEESLLKLISFKNVLEEKLINVVKLSEEIQSEIEDETEFNTDFEKYTDIEVSFRHDITILVDFIKTKQNSNKNEKHKASPLKLPKFQIKQFKGDPTNWKSFIESFDAAIDSNSDLSNIEKMNFLVNYVEGEAESVIKGLLLSHDNYKTAKEMLEERFGDEQVLISTHMQKLLNLETVTNIDDVKKLRRLYDEVETQVRSLSSLGLDSKSYGSMLTPVLLSKIPDDLKLVISRKFGKSIWDIGKILESFNLELEAREKISPNSENSAEKFYEPFTGSSLHVGSRYNNNRFGYNDDKFRKESSYAKHDKRDHFQKIPNFSSCIFCGRNHPSKNCDVVTKPEVRKDILFKERRCFVCMKRGHISKNCRNDMKCFKCKGRHHVAVCIPKQISDIGSDNKPKNNETFHSNLVDSAHKLLHINKTDSILLQTARAKVCSTDETQCKNLRLLFDSGSQLSYISPRAKDQLKLKTLETKDISVKTFGNNKSNENFERVNFAVKSRDGNLNIYVDAFVSKICYPIEEQVINIAQENYSHLQNLKLADENPENLPMDIDILIGAKDYWNFIDHNTVRGAKGPIALASKLGYILSGAVENKFVKSVKSSSSSNVVSTHFLKVAAEILDKNYLTNNQVKTCFEEKSILNQVNSDESEIFDKFKEDTNFINDRYEVKLPFKEIHEELGDNYVASKNRLKTLLNKFKNNEELLIEYNRIINEQKNLNIIEHAQEYKVNSTYYLPHRPVVREDKDSTKVRMVFDASAKSRKNGPSLNDVLETGPSLTPLLYDVLLRYRSFNYVVIADIEKAFLQISLSPEHRDFARFLWFENINEIDFENFENNKLIEYRLCRVLFGVASSPFLLSATLIKHIELYIEDDPQFVEKLLNCLHVDDLTTGENSVEKAFEFYVKSKARLNEGGFNLRKFKSNSKELEGLIYEAYPGDEIFSNNNKVLGLIWDKNTDTIDFSFNEIRSKFVEHPTKRSVIQSIASIFDPLGLISPITVKMKVFFQDVCIKKFNWDEDLSSELQVRWYDLLTELEQIELISIQRNYCFNDINDPIVDVQMHAFSDASKRMYACAVYLRFRLKSGLIKTSLVTSKSRVLSIKGNVTIPRAELNGVLFMTQIVPELVKSLSSVYTISKLFFWTDASIVCAWVKNVEKSYEKYIQKRLEQIRGVINKGELKLVPSLLNPADIGTRGLTPLQLSESEFWFFGPKFLSQSENSWPNLEIGDNFTSYMGKKNQDGNTNNTLVKNDAENLVASYTGEKFNVENYGDIIALVKDSVENINTCLLSANVQNDACLSRIIQIDRFNSLTKLLRVTGWVIKFVNKLKWRVKKKKEDYNKEELINKNKIEENINGEELDQAKMLWVREVQKELIKGKSFKNLRLQLDLFVDENEIWRCGGRLKNAPIAYETKYPIIIPKEHYFAKLIILNSHAEVKHNGPRETINNIRSEFWIPQCRSIVRKLIHNCSLCRRFEGKPYDYPKVGPLPEARVSHDDAFSHIGIDYAGPVYVKNVYIVDNDKAMYKAWIVLITCASSRCIYLDLVPDCSGKSCVDALTRFINSRGAPKLIISDNGTAFISREVQDFASSRGMRWKFNIPNAPWMGGFFERMVQSVKRCLRKLLLNARLNYEEMITVLREIENVLNNRPLTFVYSNDLVETLTPNKLLYGRNIETIVTNRNDIMNEVDITKRVNYVKNIVDHFWSRWRSEYLRELREHNKVKNSKNAINPSINDVVLIYDEKLKRSSWRIGRIKNLITSRDGQVRAAEVNVITNGALSTLSRPINKLYPVEFSKNTEVENVYSNNDNENTEGGVQITFVDENKVAGVFGKIPIL